MIGGRRSALVVGIAAVLVLAGVLTQPERDPETGIAAGPRLPAAEQSTAAWFCAEGTSSPDGRADEEIEIGNVDTRAAQAIVTVFGGSEVAPVRRKYAVASGRVVRVRVADIAALPDPGVLVEVSGGRTVVEHRISRGDDTALGPCAREPASTTRFAAGTTGKGAELWLALFNPFPDDAIVDVRATSESGIRAPGSLQGLVVPRFSRLSVPMHDRVPRVDLVATEVTTRRGRVVAEQSLALDGSDGRRGLALTLGSEAARRWWFPIGLTGSGHSERLVISNSSALSTRVTVTFALDAAAAIEPQSLVLPATSVISVDLSRVPPDIGFSLAVASEVPIVAEMVGSTTAPQPADVRGIAADLGFTSGAKEWAVVPSRLAPGSDDTISMVSTDGRPHRVQISRATDAGRRVIARVKVPATGRVTVTLSRDALGALGVNVALLVRADGPVAVVRESTRPGLTRSHAVRGSPS